MSDLTILLPVAFIQKIAKMLATNQTECLHIAPGGNTMTAKRIKHPENGQDYIQINSEFILEE